MTSRFKIYDNEKETRQMLRYSLVEVIGQFTDKKDADRYLKTLRKSEKNRWATISFVPKSGETSIPIQKCDLNASVKSFEIAEEG